MFKFLSLFNRKKSYTQEDNKIVGMHTFDGVVTPKQGYHFFDDYFKIDHCYASILTFFHNHGANRIQGLPPMWGIYLLPKDLGHDISTHLLLSFSPEQKAWVSRKLSDMDDSTSNVRGNAEASNHTRSKLFASYRSEDVDQINADIADGDNYFDLDFQLVVKAPTLRKLDQSVDALTRWYDQILDSGMYLHPFNGEQYRSLRLLLNSPKKQIGNGYMMTASELAGMYNIVSQGVNDPAGDYVGNMVGDINQAAVVWDMDGFPNHAVIAADQIAKSRMPLQKFPSNTRGSAMWGVKLAQKALADGHRVIHLVLNNADIAHIGADLSGITTYIAMNKGAINPFEIFGKRSQAKGALEENTEKLRLMARQLNSKLGPVTLGKYFTNLVKDFYNDIGMLNDGPEAAQRLVELKDHTQYPRLQRFCVYLRSSEKIASRKGDTVQVHSLLNLEAAFYQMMSPGNRPLFNKWTSNSIDSVHGQRQIIYDFSDLAPRGKGIAMAQFLNAFNFAIKGLSHGDILMIHGTENIDGKLGARYSVKTYVANMIEQLRKKDVRVVYLYDSVQKMLDDTRFNRFDSADWVLTGYMSNNLVLQYQKDMNRKLPKYLAQGIIHDDPLLYYLRRGVSNVLFEATPTLNYYY